MEDIRIVRSNYKDFVCDKIKFVSTDRSALKEMGEPFIYDPSQTWIFAYKFDQLAGFICYDSKNILYVYVFPEFRNKGLFSVLYNELPNKEWETIASNMSYKLFLNKGFEVLKNYKNCHKLIKK